MKRTYGSLVPLLVFGLFAASIGVARPMPRPSSSATWST